jgi:hypothetical protein
VDGKRRIDDENDRVRLEIEAAFRREIPIIPVLTQGASHPTKAMLPPSLEALAYRHGTSIRHEHFRGDVDSLINQMDKLLACQQSTPSKPAEPEEPRETDADATSEGAPVSLAKTAPQFSARAAPPELEQAAGPIYQKPQETNVDASSDASTAPQAKIKSRVSNRRRELGWPLAFIFDRDLLIFVTKWTLACLLGEAVGGGVGIAALRAMDLAGPGGI